MYLIRSKPFKDLSPATQKSLLAATLPTGSMKPSILSNTSTKTYICYSKSKNILYGWLVLGKIKTTSKNKSIMLFVKPKHRGKNIGKLLVQESLKYINENDKVIVFPWDTTSTSFWNSMKKEFPNLILVDAYRYYFTYGNLSRNWSA